MIDMIDHGLTMAIALSEGGSCGAVKMYSLAMLQRHILGYHRT